MKESTYDALGVSYERTIYDVCLVDSYIMLTFYLFSRYRGHFVPPLKTVSLLDVSNYEDEKWPHKFIDQSSFFIKDVPPKKRALPLIPARNSSSIRYQPPDFD